MNGHTSGCPVRLSRLSLPAKITLTLFLALLGTGYLVATGNIYFQHSEKDGQPGMSIDDLRATFHGMEIEVTEDVERQLPSEMLEMVEPGGSMRPMLDAGGPEAVHTLIHWLEAGAPESTFDQPPSDQPNYPSPKQVIARCCVQCHHAAGGDMQEVPYAPTATAEPEYVLVAKEATPDVEVSEETGMMTIHPTSTKELVHITHAHIMSIPVFVLIVASLFFLTGVSAKVKLILGPLPMLATCLDFLSWWLARQFEPAIYLIALAGALFGITLALQLFIVLGSMWFGRADTQETT